MKDYSDIDLVYLWLDFGDVWLKTATTEMIRSAQRAMPGINIIQISDQAARKHPLVNSAMVFDQIIEQNDVAAFRGYAFARHALQTEKPTIYCDIDVIWNDARLADDLRRQPREAITIMHRPDRPSMSYCTTVMHATPGHAPFWQAYFDGCHDLKGNQRTYGGDQFVLGSYEVLQHGRWTRFERMTVEPDVMPTAKLDCASVHFAAHRDWLVPYARLLDGGAPFEALMPGLGDIIYETGEDLTDQSADYNYGGGPNA